MRAFIIKSDFKEKCKLVPKKLGIQKARNAIFSYMTHRRHRTSYWGKNLLWIKTLLILWSLLALGGGVLWVTPLNKLRIGELPLGFWIAQQGAVIGFVSLVFAYAIGMDRLDNQHAQSNSKQRSQIEPYSANRPDLSGESYDHSA